MVHTIARHLLPAGLLFVTCALFLHAQSGFTLTYPKGGDVLYAGSQVLLRWDGVPRETFVRLEYSIDSGATWHEITGSATEHAYAWTVPSYPSVRCLLRATTKSRPPAYVTLTGHAEPVNSASFSTTGRWVATSSDDNTVRIWDAASGALVRPLTGHADSNDVFWTAFGPEDRLIATAGGDHTVRIWSGPTGEEVRILKGYGSRVQHAAFSPDGKQLATACDDGTVRIWNTGNWQLRKLITGHSNGVWAASYSPDGRYLLTSSRDFTARIWRVADWAPVRAFLHPDAVFSARYSPDGTRIVTACRDRIARIWNVATGREEVQMIGHTDWVWRAAFRPDGNEIATAGRDGLIKLWSPITGELLRTLHGHRSDVGSAEYSPDGTQLVSGANDHTGRIWSLAGPGTVEQACSNTAWEIRSPAIKLLKPEASDILIAGDSATIVWDVQGVVSAVRLEYSFDNGDTWNTITDTATGTSFAWRVPESYSGRCLLRAAALGMGLGFSELRIESPQLVFASYSNTGRWVATSDPDRTAKLWDASSGTLSRTLVGHTGTVRSIAFDRDDRLIATASDDSTVIIWSAGTGTLIRRLTGSGGVVHQVTFSPDGTELASAGDAGTIRIWNVKLGHLVREIPGHTGAIYSVAYSSDGRYLASSGRDMTARIWEAGSWAQVQSFEHANVVSSAQFSPDGSKVVTGCRDDVARVWNVATGREELRLAGHANWVRKAMYSPDGREIATAGLDGTIILWSASNGTLLKTLYGYQRDIATVDYDPAGQRIVSAGNARIWSKMPEELAASQMDSSCTVVKLTGPGGGRAIAVHCAPNPADNVTEIRCTPPETGEVRIVLIDASGKIAATVLDERRPAGLLAIGFPTTSLPSGKYLVAVRARNVSGSTTLTIQH